MTDTYDLARIAWDAYSTAVGGKAFNGDDLPPFEQAPEHIQGAWFAAVTAVANRLRDDEGAR
jgi:hypothetical protein